MHKPRDLTGAAGEFWQRNAPHLLRAGLLSDATRDAFILLCRSWEKLLAADQEDTIKWVALSKRIDQGLKAFAMLPDSRRRMKIDDEEETLDEYGIPV